MDKVKLGRTDLAVSRICLGTMTFGEQNTEAEAHAQLDYALSRGINFIDTAEMYPVMPKAATTGSTERFIGSWLKQRGKRDDVIIATKVAGPTGMSWIREGKSNLDRAAIRAAIDASLRRLQTDYVDLYQLHWPSRNVPIFGQNYFDPAKEREHVPIGETLEALDELVKAGKVRHIGVSNESSWGVCEFTRLAEQDSLPRIASIQNLYNLCARAYETTLLTETCYREDVSLLAYSPLAFGQLTAKYVDNPKAPGRLTRFPPGWSPRYLRPAVFDAVREYAALARSRGMTPAAMALAWTYSRWFVASTIIGATTLDQLAANIDAFDVKLDAETEAAIDAIHTRIMNPGQ